MAESKWMKMRLFIDFCPRCGKILSDDDRVTRWIHDILNHRKYFEAQTKDSPGKAICEILYEIIDHYHKPDDEIEPGYN